MNSEELSKMRVLIAKDIYVHHAKEHERTFTKSNFEDKLSAAKKAFQAADYFIAASLKETTTLQALKRRIDKHNEQL